MKALVLIPAFLLAGNAIADVPSVHEIDAAFSFGSTNRECYTNVYPYLNRVFNCEESDVGMSERAQYCIMTNVLARPLQMNGDNYNNFRPKIQLMTWVCGFQALRRDPGAVCHCADYIGGVQLVSTNAYEEEMREAIQSNDVGSCRARWSPIFSYNNRIPSFRNSLIETFSPMAWTYIKTLDEPERGSFVTNLYQRARMSSSEQEAFTAAAEYSD